MTFKEGLKEWWNDPEKLWGVRFPNFWLYRKPTLRDSLWLLVGIGLVGAVTGYILGQSLGVIISLDLTFTLAGFIGLAIMWWKERQTTQ